MTVAELRKHFYKGRAFAYAWPGGYPLFYLCSDSGTLCPDCVSKNRARIFRATHEWHHAECGARVHCGWSLVAVDVNWEDGDMLCDHCGKAIEAAYVDVPESDVKESA